MEIKGRVFALHYRQCKQYQNSIIASAQKFIEYYPQLVLQLCSVVELKLAGLDKGMAIMSFMQEAPFASRTPLFFFYDLTDEAGCRQVNALQVISIKVGPGNTVTNYH